MLLFIFESIGTSELVLIGIVALIFLGPRKLPEIARKIGKIMAEFRSTTQDFKSTWEREVNFEEEAKAFEIDLLEEEAAEKRLKETPAISEVNTIGAPTVKEIDKESFDSFVSNAERDDGQEESETEQEAEDVLSDKRTWL